MSLMLAVALAAAKPTAVADAFNYTEKAAGVTDRFNRGVITRQRDDEHFTVSVTPAAEKWGRYVFTVAIFNKSGAPVNVDASSVTVTLLDGTVVPALGADRVKQIASNRAGWARFGQAMAGALAGASSYGYANSNSYGYGSGYAGGRSFNYSGYSHTRTTYYDPTAAAINAAENRRAMEHIQAGLDDLIANVNENYMSTTTVDADSGFAGQVMVDKMKFKKRRGESAVRRQFLMRVSLGGFAYEFPFTVNGK